MDPIVTPSPTPSPVTVEGVVVVSPISISSDLVYPFLFLATLYVGIAFVRLVRSLSTPISLRD